MFGASLCRKKEKKKEKERAGKGATTPPPIFYYFENTTNPYFLSLCLKLVFVFVGLRMESRIKVVLSVCSGRSV